MDLEETRPFAKAHGPSKDEKIELEDRGDGAKMGWKDIEFGGSDSAERVRRLQAFCSDGRDGAFDALLIVGGVDSYHSELSQAVLKYLFLGSSGQELLGTQVISQEHDRLEDVVLLLTQRRVSIYYSSESDAAVTVLPVISQWRNVTEWTIHDAMDPDEQEARKIRAFRDMVRGVSRIGIPYGTDAHGNDLQDPMIPEKWPLVQAYGLDEHAGGGKGFFTMNHSVVNVSRLVRDELARLDDFGAKRVAKEVPPMLAHHFNQFLLKLDHAETPAVRSAKSEAEMGEDLLSLYEFGTTQHDARGLAVLEHRGSRVLFGTRTAQATTAKSSSTVFVHNAGPGGARDRPASHMLVQTEDPFSGVRFTRTYFLATGKTAPRVVDEDALVQSDSDVVVAGRGGTANEQDTSADTRVLIELYVLLLRGFRRAVRAFVAHAGGADVSLDECLAAAKTDALRELRAAQVRGLDPDFVTKHFVVDAESLDACGRGTRFPGQKWNLVYLTCELQRVPSQIVASETLVSLVVGDTLLFSRAPSDTTIGQWINTTASFAYFRSWIQPGREFESVKAQLAVLQSGFMLQSPALRLGQPMAPLDASLDEAMSNSTTDPASSIAPATATPAVTSVGLARATLLLESDELPQLQGSMQLFTGGFCFKTPHVIPLMVSFAKHVASFRVLSTPYEELVLLQVELKAESEDGATTPLSKALPFPTTSRVIAFPLLAGTRFQEEIVHALSVWKTTAESLGIPFYRPHDLVQFDGETPRDDRAVHHRELSPLFAKACTALVRRSSPSDGVTDALFPRWFIPKDANPTTTLPKPRKNDRAKTVVPITVVLGLPGSSARAIARTICDVSSAATEWARVDIDCREASQGDHSGSRDQDAYTATQIQQRIGVALGRILDASASELPPRLMLCVIAYVDAVTVAAAIKTAQSEWRLPTKIASVIGCVSATNAYLPDALGAQCALPRLFDQLASGFTTHVVVTHTNDVPASALGRLRYHIDQTNPFADIHVLSSDVFEGSLTPLLCVDRFESAYYTNYRAAQFPDWDIKQGFTQRYRAEMDPAVVPESVRFELAPGIEKARFLQSVGKTLTPYAAMTKSMDKIHPVDPQLMARQQQHSRGGIRLAQTLAADKVLAQQRQQLQDDVEAYGECWCVEALVSFAGDLDMVYEYVSTGAYARMAVVHQANNKTTSLEVKITGRGLHPAKIQELILGCYVNLDGAVRPLKSKVTLTIEEKREIQRLHIMDDLPEGFYYDGVTYIDQFGGRHEFHPRMNEFIDEHLRSLNEKTTQHNAHVEENRKSQQAYVRQIV